MHYKMLWDVATGYIINGCLNCCSMQIVERGLGRVWCGGFFLFFNTDFFLQLLFLLQIEKQIQHCRQRLLKFIYPGLSHVHLHFLL